MIQITICHTYRDFREVNGWDKNCIFTVEKRISVFIGRTIFSLVKNDLSSILLGYTVFSLVKKIVLSFCSQRGRRVGKVAKGLSGFYVKKKKSFSNKKHETKRRTALTHYLGQITKK